MKHSMRNWHTWASVVLGLPLLLVGLTTFFIAHEKSIGTKDIALPMGHASADVVEIRSSLQVGSERWIGTKQGVFRLEADRAVPLSGSPQDEIRGLVTAGDAVLMAGKKALWRYQDGKAGPVYKADCWQITSGAGGYAAACKDTGLLVSVDGSQWQPRPVEFPARAGAAKEGLSLAQIVMDIHTGKLFLGKQYEWIWIDLLGLACVGLGMTGLTMWMRSRRHRAGGA